jgi:hypothetical protein
VELTIRGTKLIRRNKRATRTGKEKQHLVGWEVWTEWTRMDEVDVMDHNEYGCGFTGLRFGTERSGGAGSRSQTAR